MIPNIQTNPDTLVVAAAHDLLAACQAQHEAIDRLFVMLMEKTKDEEPHCFFPSQCGQPWAACKQGAAAIRKATGR